MTAQVARSFNGACLYIMYSTYFLDAVSVGSREANAVLGGTSRVKPRFAEDRLAKSARKLGVRSSICKAGSLLGA